MKTVIKIFLLSTLTAGIFSSVNAQRIREFSGRTRDNNSGSSRQMTTRSAPVRTFSRTPDRNYQAPRVVQRSTTRVYNSPERNVVARNDYNRYRQTEIVRNNYYRGSYHPYYSSNRYYGNVYGRRTGFMYGPRYTVIPRSFISIHFGGHPYYYNRGYFYGFYDGYYMPIFPPFGLQISILPFGYTRIFIGGIPFFYYNGIYYRQYNNYYEVVDAPMGATVSALPQGARSVIINGEKLYELNGTYYKADRDANGNDVFIVVGKNGVVNNTVEPENNTEPQGDINNSPSSLQIGDIISQLPEGSKVVTLNGQQLYQTPDDIYLQQEDNNGVVEYKVVGK